MEMTKLTKYLRRNGSLEETSNNNLNNSYLKKVIDLWVMYDAGPQFKNKLRFQILALMFRNSSFIFSSNSHLIAVS